MKKILVLLILSCVLFLGLKKNDVRTVNLLPRDCMRIQLKIRKMDLRASEMCMMAGTPVL